NKDQQAWFAVRPEKLKVSRTKPKGNNNAVKGEMWDFGYLGDMTILHVKLESGLIVRASMLNAERAVENPITIDDDVWLSFSSDSGVLLDR
ncbi:MAG: TOBE domain-containing protein, partial [Pseudomonadota bacterium]